MFAKLSGHVVTDEQKQVEVSGVQGHIDCKIDGDEIVIRPMMYLAFSYDHRIIDGKESVGFLINIKSLLENPSKIVLGI